MQKATGDKYERIIFYSLLIFLVVQAAAAYIIFIGEYLRIDQLFVMNVFLVIFISIYALTIRSRWKRKPLALADLWMALLIVFGTLSVIHAIDLETAIFGKSGRHEGAYALLCYYFIFLCATLLTEDRKKKLLVYVFLLLGTVISIVGWAATYGLFPQQGRIKQAAIIPFENQNFYGSFIVLYCSIVMGMFLYCKNKKQRLLSVCLLILGYGALFCSSTSSTFVGMIMAGVLFAGMEWILLIQKKDKRLFGIHMGRMGMCLLIFIGMAVFMDVTRSGAVFAELKSGVTGVKDGVTQDRAFSGRMYIWKNALSELKNYWKFGVGIDNFLYMMDSKQYMLGSVHIDKAHNEYIQILMTEGIGAIIVYLLHLFTVFRMGLKRWIEGNEREEEEWLYQALLLAFLGYAAQAFFNISVINVAPFFWLICGLLYKRTVHDEKTLEKRLSKKDIADRAN